MTSRIRFWIDEVDAAWIDALARQEVADESPADYVFHYLHGYAALLIGGQYLDLPWVSIVDTAWGFGHAVARAAHEGFVVGELDLHTQSIVLVRFANESVLVALPELCTSTQTAYPELVAATVDALNRLLSDLLKRWPWLDRDPRIARFQKLARTVSAHAGKLASIPREPTTHCDVARGHSLRLDNDREGFWNGPGLSTSTVVISTPSNLELKVDLAPSGPANTLFNRFQLRLTQLHRLTVRGGPFTLPSRCYSGRWHSWENLARRWWTEPRQGVVLNLFGQDGVSADVLAAEATAGWYEPLVSKPASSAGLLVPPTEPGVTGAATHGTLRPLEAPPERPRTTGGRREGERHGPGLTWVYTLCHCPDASSVEASVIFESLEFSDGRATSLIGAGECTACDKFSMSSFAFPVLVDLFEGIRNCKYLSTYHVCIHYDYGAGHGLLLSFHDEGEVFLRDGFPCLYCLGTRRRRQVLRSKTNDLRDSCADVMADLLAWKIVRYAPGRSELERLWTAVTSAPEWGLTCVLGDEGEGNLVPQANEAGNGATARHSNKRAFHTLNKGLTALSRQPMHLEALRYELPLRLEWHWRYANGHVTLICEGIRWVHIELARTEAHRDKDVQQWLTVERRPRDLWRVVLWRRHFVHAVCYADRLSLDMG